MVKKLTYKTQGTCSSHIELEVEDGVICEVFFWGGCNGNLQGIRKLVKGMKIEEVIEKLEPNNWKVDAYYLTNAITAAADPECYPELAEQYGVWVTPKLYLHLYEENEIMLDVEVELTRDPQGRTPFQIATEAYKCHVSQHKWPYRVQYGEDRAFDCRPFGLYHSLLFDFHSTGFCLNNAFQDLISHSTHLSCCIFC